MVRHGQLVAAAGPPQSRDGYTVVPIKPRGVVDASALELRDGEDSLLDFPPPLAGGIRDAVESAAEQATPRTPDPGASRPVAPGAAAAGSPAPGPAESSPAPGPARRKAKAEAADAKSGTKRAPQTAPQRAPEAAPQFASPSQMTRKQAKSLLNEIMEIFEVPGNKKKLKAAVKQAKELSKDSNQLELQLMMLLMPVAQEMLRELFQRYKFQESHLLLCMMQLRKHSLEDSSMKKKVDRLQSYLDGTVE